MFAVVVRFLAVSGINVFMVERQLPTHPHTHPIPCYHRPYRPGGRNLVETYIERSSQRIPFCRATLQRCFIYYRPPFLAFWTMDASPLCLPYPAWWSSLATRTTWLSLKQPQSYRVIQPDKVVFQVATLSGITLCWPTLHHAIGDYMSTTPHSPP